MSCVLVVRQDMMMPRRVDFDLVRELMIETGVLDRKIDFDEYVGLRFAIRAGVLTAWSYEPAVTPPNRRTFMDRRNLICGVGAIGTAGFTAAEAAAKETTSVTWKVKGFTCITCAVGLEVMLRQEEGVTRAKANYPLNSAAIGFDAKLISEKVLKEFIAGGGFSVA